MPRYSPETVLSHCVCGMNKGAHEPSEAYYMEERLEGRKSSSTAKRSGCTGYRPAGLTLREVMRLRGCEYRWRHLRYA